MSSIWDEQKQQMQAQLGTQEKLLWYGQPRTGLLLRAADAYLIPLSIWFCAFAVFWEGIVLKSGETFLLSLPGIPMVAYGLFGLIGRFFFDAKQRAGTWYAVTNERIIISSGIFSRQIKSLSLLTLAEMSLVERSDGSGTITFGIPVPILSRRRRVPFPGVGQPLIPLFEFIPDVSKVHEIIRNAQRQAKDIRK